MKSLNEKNREDNKQFCRTVKQLFSSKIKSSGKTTLVEHRESVKKDGNIEYEIDNDDVSMADKISHPLFKVILK